MEIMKMINEMNVNHKVGGISIRFSKNNNPINKEILRMMNNSYNNVYWIDVRDDNNSVDNIIHDQIKQLVRQSVVMIFNLRFDGGDLFSNNDG